MDVDDFFFQPFLDFLIKYPILSNTVLGASLVGNAYLFKKFRENNKLEKNYINWLKDIEPLLAKIISGEKFNKTEKGDAKTIRDMIKSKIREDVK